MNLIASPSAVLLILGLLAVVTLQVTGDIQQAVCHVKNKKTKKSPSKRNYLISDSLSAALYASNYALTRYKHRATQESTPNLKRNSIMRISWPLTGSVLCLLTTVIWLEGLLPACLLALLYIGVMTAVGFLAWPTDSSNNPTDKLAIALLAPYSVFCVFTRKS